MQAAKLKDVTFNTTPQAVFDAVLGVIQNGKFGLFAVSNEKHRILFTSGKTALSWGQEYIAEVTPAADGATALHLVCGGVDGRPKALLDGWKNGKAADKVIAAVRAVLDGTTTAPATPTASFRTAADGTQQLWDDKDFS